MAYLGRSPAVGTQRMLDSIESQFNGVLTTFDLRYTGLPTYPTLSSSLIVSLGGVLQEPGEAFYVSSDKIVFSEPPQTGTECWILLYSQYGTGVGAAQQGMLGAETLTLTGELRGPSIFVIDPATVGDDTGLVRIKGDLEVLGATTTINSSTLTIDDKNIVIADGASTLANIDAAGIDFGTTAVRIRYNHNAGTNSALSIEGANVGFGQTSVTAVFGRTVSTTGSNGATYRVAGASTSAYLFTSDGLGYGGLLQETNHPLILGTNSSERARIDTSGRLLVGATSARANFYNTTISSRLQVEGANNGDARSASVVYGQSTASGPILILGKHRSDSVGGTTIVATNDELGALTFQGSDGTEFVPGAQIWAFVDGTPGANSMPGRLVFSTTTSGQSSPTERMRIASGGNVGIGTTNPTSALHVLAPNSAGAVSALIAMENNHILRLARVAPAVGPGNLDLTVTTNGAGRISTDENLTLQSGVSSPLIFSTNGANERARIDSLGRLLVGASTSITGASVEANSALTAFRFGGVPELGLWRANGSVGSPTIVADSNILGRLYAVGYDGANYINAARIEVAVDGTPGINDMPGRLVFSTTADGASAPTERMRITSSGNVGIGTTNPVERLHVYSSSSVSSISIDSGNSGTTIYYSLGGVRKYTTEYVPVGDFYAIGRSGVAYDLSLKSGNVGIGTTNPNTTLHVNGRIQTTDFTSTSNANALVNSFTGCFQTGLRVLHSTTPKLDLWHDGNSVGQFRFSNGVLTYGTHNGNDSVTDRLTIDLSGNVGIGTTNPLDKLHVSAGNIRTTGGYLTMFGLASPNHENYIQMSANGVSYIGIGPELNPTIKFKVGSTSTTVLNVSATEVSPGSDNTYNLGSPTTRWANIYSADLQLSNEGSANDVDGTWGAYTIQEGEEHLYLINRRSGKKFKFVLEEVE